MRKRRHKGKQVEKWETEVYNTKVSKSFPVSLKHVAYLSHTNISGQIIASLYEDSTQLPEYTVSQLAQNTLYLAGHEDYQVH